jgi:hypothetical protein
VGLIRMIRGSLQLLLFSVRLYANPVIEFSTLQNNIRTVKHKTKTKDLLPLTRNFSFRFNFTL